MYWETPFHFKCNNPLTTRPSQAAFWLEVCPERHRLESNLVQIGNLGWDEVRTDVTCKLSNIRELFRCEQGSNLRGETPLDFEFRRQVVQGSSSWQRAGALAENLAEKGA